MAQEFEDIFQFGQGLSPEMIRRLKLLASGGGGSVNSVSAGDLLIGIGGTAADPTVSLAGLDIDGALTANSDVKVPSQKAVKTYAQPLDPDLTAIAAIDASVAGALATDGAGWIKKTYAQLKTALALVAADVGLGSVTNDAQVKLSTVTAKGDLYVATGSGAVARLGVGSDTQVLTADSAQTAGVKWAAAAGGADKLGLTPTAVKTAGYTAAAGDFVPVDTTSGGVTVTLPTAPADGSVIAVKHVKQASTNAVTIACGGTDVFDVAAGATTRTLPLLMQAIILQYKASTGIWYAVAGEKQLSSLDSRYVNSGGAAGGDLSGTYPNPSVAAGAVTVAKLAAAVTLDAIAAAYAVAADVAMNSHKITGLANGSALTDAATIGQIPLYIVKAADETRSATTTLTNDSDFSFAIGASATEVWLVDVWLAVVGANTTMDAKFGWSAPAGAAIRWGAPGQANFGGWAPVGVGSTPVATNQVGSNQPVGTNAGALIGVQFTAVVMGGGTSGNIVLQWAQNTSDAGSLTVKANSVMRYQKIKA